MAAKVDQKAYLQRYLTGSSGDKKKKKKKVVKSNRLRIIDDDLDVSKLRALDGDELDILDQGEDGPQIAGIIDERPEEVKKLEQFKTNSKWRVITQDDGFNSKVQIEEIKKDRKQQEKENEVIFGKMYSDSEDEQKNDSDASPPRKSTANSVQKSSKKLQNNSDSDISPPRKGQTDDSSRNKQEKKCSDSDQSPPRKHERSKEKSSKNRDSNYKESNSRRRDDDSDASPPRRYEKQTEDNRSDNDSDLSPPRRKEEQKSKERRKKSRWGTFEEEARADLKQRKRLNRSPSPSRKANKSKSQRSASSDHSPPRKSQKHDKRSKNYDSDASPPRKSRRDSPKSSKWQKSTDSDPSPPRKQRPSKNNSKRNKKDSDSDLSPPRKNHKQSPQSNRRKSPNSDPSPPRKSRKRSPEKSERLPYQRSSNSPPPSNKKMARTLDGKLAGLQDATGLRHENDSFRRREDEAFSRMNDEVSGRNAEVVTRKISKRETSEERRALVEKAVKQKELDDKYKKWSKGLKQVEDQQARAADFLHEASKPLARHKDDKDLEHSLREVERAGDPMLQYIRERKRERGELGPEKPTYKGQCPPNRFNIRPGYRWDGVDRSNGYEHKYFESQSKRKAQAEEYHKWSCADL